MMRMFGFFACAKELPVETATATARSVATISFDFISVNGARTQEITQRTDDRSPPNGWSPRPVPTPGSVALQFRCHVLVLRYLLPNSELLVALILLFAADVGETCFLVFIDVEDSFSFHGGPLNLVRWQGSIDLLLLRRLRRTGSKASRR